MSESWKSSIAQLLLFSAVSFEATPVAGAYSQAIGEKNVCLAPRVERKLAEVPTRALNFTPTDPVLGISAIPIMAAPRCNGDTLFLDEVKPPDLKVHTFYSVRGRAAHTFVIETVPGLHDVYVKGMFPSETQVGVLLSATREASPERIRRASHSHFVAEFDLDGRYKSLVELATTYDVSQMALFSSGELLVVGYDDAADRPRLDLLNADGTLIRRIDFPGARLKRDLSGSPAARSRSDNLLRGSILLTPYAGSVLVVRDGSTDPVLEVRPGGVVREVPIHPPTGFVLADLISANDRWVAHFKRADLSTEMPHNTNDPELYSYYEVDPKDGSLTRRLVLSGNRGGTLSCENDGLYTSFEINKDGKFVLLTAS